MVSEEFKAKARRWATKLECPVDEDRDYENTYWCNRDLIPIPRERRTWTWQGYAGYWIINGINTTAWTAGSSLLALGLSVGQAMGVIVGASLFAAVISVIAGWPGSHQYLGFTILSRAQWGMRGGFWPVLNRIMTTIIWMGIQLYWGGQAVKIILGAIIGHPFVHMKNTLPESANVDTASLISFFVFVIVFLPTLMVPPEKLQKPFLVAFGMIAGTMFGMLIWALCAAHGAGTLVSTGPTKHGSALSWGTLYGLQSLVGGYGSGCLGQADWTRYSKYPNAALFGQAVTAPIAISITALCGLLITSATAKIYGEVYWNPFELLLAIQDHSLSPGARAGTFFAALGFAASQFALCIVLNSVSAGMDMAALMPKYINIRRGAYILTLISICICPWQYVTRATVFITVLSGWSVFLSPMTGILCSDYFLVRKREYHIGDLYLGVDTAGAYWYTAGFNWRGFVAWAMALWPMLPGFVRNVKGISDGAGWDRLYQMSYFFGFLTAGLLYWAFHTIFPAEKQTGSSPFTLKAHHQRVQIGDEKLGVIDGQPVEAFEALPGTGHKQLAKAESTSVDSA
ncbi:Uracil permease [Cyphellophora attinorum]|uniref:Uracil permease n=1 Tax=Cyphellophora attinorum TaxID=1664694 RepID=A0A0N1HBR2_9EURO|nr:Uracil permease [Phialophora attinorum]KPI41863.1 Uracil permease [Phialophora attinorum]